ncbi:MAG: FlgD immunoglobulin-like domain containing protein [candidate division WOR-3 bacterium]
MKRLARLVSGVLLLTAVAAAGRGGVYPAETLPAPEYHNHSFELLSNSRYSVHSGFTEDLPRQVLANVLWAMSRVPRLGTYREIYVATPENVYLYEPGSNTLVVHRTGDLRYNSGSAFEAGIACARHEEAGMAIQAGLLAATAFWARGGGLVASCPMRWATDYANANWGPAHTIRMVNVCGRAQTEGLDTLLVALSSDSSLPLPHVIGEDAFEPLLAELRQDSQFGAIAPSIENISQLLWAAYGVTPHNALNARQGLTVPSSMANYHLTGRIYLVRSEGVDRFHNRLPPGNNLNTADHRLERVVIGDRRPELRQASERIPQNAPIYFVIAVSDTSGYAPMQEAGFAAFQFLMQAAALGLNGYLTVPLTTTERSAIANALSLPAGQYPAVVFSCGERVTGIAERSADGMVRIVRGQSAVRRGVLRVEYLLRRSGEVRVEVFDLLGRPVRLLLDAVQSSGYHSIVWDGTDEQGSRVKRGTYVVVVSAEGEAAQHRVNWSR